MTTPDDLVKLARDCGADVSHFEAKPYVVFDCDQLTAFTARIAPQQDAPQAREPEWRDIASAPRDELILVGPTKRMGICAAMNHSRDGWVTETCSEWVPIYTPTLWQPLPSPPHSDAIKETR